MAFLQNFQTITTLELYSGTVRTFDNILSIVGALPQLRRLCLMGLHWYSRHNASVAKPPIFYLQELDLESEKCIADMLSWLLSYDRIPPIKRLKLAFVFTSPYIGQLLRAIGPTLEHLSLYKINDTQSMSHTRGIHLFHL
jgi:hypothetical protein